MSSYEYHQILQFLYFEGYADSYESAEHLVEQLTEEEYVELCERATRPTRFPKSRERDIGHDDWKDSDPDNRDWNQRPPAAKKLRSRLNAVVGTQKRQDIETGVRKEAHSFPLNKKERQSVENIGRMNRGDFSVSPDEKPTPTRTRSASRPAPKTKKRKTDLSKVIIAQYLYDEGFADTPESGSVMAESISEQWANQILDEEYKDLTPEKEERVKNRVGELARDIQVQSGRMKDLKKKPFGKYRPKVKQEKEAILKSARKKQKLVQNASDALIRTSTSRSASIQKRIQDLKDQS
jgi:hypothetical protein